MRSLSKLKCRKHGLRVMVLGSSSVRHREDGKACFTDYVVIRKKNYTPTEIAEGNYRELDPLLGYDS